MPNNLSARMEFLNDKWLGFKLVVLGLLGVAVGQTLVTLAIYENLGRILTGVGILLGAGGMVMHFVSVGEAISKKRAEEKAKPTSTKEP